MFQTGPHPGSSWNWVCTRSITASRRPRKSRHPRRGAFRTAGEVRPREFARGRELRAMAKDRDEMNGGHAKAAPRPTMMKLREILDGVGTIAIAGSLDAEIRAVVCDSR